MSGRMRFGTIALIAATAVAMAATASPAGADIVSVTGSVTEIAPPASVAPGALESATIAYAFDEALGVTAPEGGIKVDATKARTYSSNKQLTRGTIAAGTLVDSHLLHIDPPRKVKASTAGSITFDGNILGVASQTATLAASDGALGAPGTTYGGNVQYRGFELGQDTFTISADRRTLSFTAVTQPVTDELRVITSHTYSLTTSINDSPDPVTAGDKVLYTVTVTNNDVVTVPNVQMTDTLPSETPTFDSASPSQGTCPSGPASGPVVCNLGSIASGSSATVQILVTTPSTVPESGFITDQATASPGANNNTATEDTTISAQSQGTGSGYVPPGGSITTNGTDPATLSLPDTGNGSPVDITQGPGSFCPGGCDGTTTTVSEIDNYNDPNNPIDLVLEYDFPSTDPDPLTEAANAYSEHIYKFDGTNTTLVPNCDTQAPGAKAAIASGVPSPCLYQKTIAQPSTNSFVVTFEILYNSGDPTWGKK